MGKYQDIFSTMPKVLVGVNNCNNQQMEELKCFYSDQDEQDIGKV